MAYVHHSEWFYGVTLSEKDLETGYISYETLAKTFSHILNNNIITATSDIGYWEVVNGSEFDAETDEAIEVFQYYIIDANGAYILEHCTDELVWYNADLDMYVWGVTHFGTAWSYCQTDIKIDLGNN